MKKENIICSAILGASIIIGGLALRSGIVAFKDRDRQVSVKGLAEKEMKADKVTWPLIYKEIGNDPSELYSKLATKNASVVAFLKQGGITDKEISVNPPSVEDRQADSYGNDVLNYRYKATSVITVTSADIDKVRRLMTQQAELMKQGIPIVTEQYGDHAVRYDFISTMSYKNSTSITCRRIKENTIINSTLIPTYTNSTTIMISSVTISSTVSKNRK